MKGLKKIAVFATLFAVIALTSACNRGVGCPSEFKTSKQVSK